MGGHKYLEGDGSFHYRSSGDMGGGSGGSHNYFITTEKEKESDSMGDIAGLLALMQGNKGMDLPGLLALCKDKGYSNGFGGEGGFLWAFLLLFLFANGGWGGMGAQNRAAFAEMAGNNCSQITGLYDRIYAAQAESAQGFLNLDTKICSSIASVIASVRDQGDRTYDASRNVGDTVRDCCCKLEAELASITCGINSLSRDVRDVNTNLSAKIELEALKQENARAAMECRITQQQKDCCCEINSRFDRLECTLATNRLEDENARLARKVEELSDVLRGDRIANAAVAQLQNFALNNYTPTRTPTPGNGA